MKQINYFAHSGDIAFTNSLDPDQAWQNIGPDLFDTETWFLIIWKKKLI